MKITKKELQEMIAEELSILSESKEPQVIVDMRDVVENGYRKVKDPKSGKKLTVDSFTASAITQVYDALKDDKIKEKFASQGILRMQKLALKFIK